MDKVDKSELEAAAEETASAADPPHPQFSRGRLAELLRLVQQLMATITSSCNSADEMRYVVTVLKGAVDLWSRGGQDRGR